MKNLLKFSLALVLIAVVGQAAFAAEPAGRWTEARANTWYRQQPWLVGANFSPSTAINQLEMWQADTFDLATIDRELGWAEQLGFTSMRVFLHDLPYRQDAPGFLKRMDQFLGVAKKHHIGIMFVLLDSCWDPFPKSGPQRAPKPHLHNSGWVQCPGREILENPQRHDELKPYVQGVLRRFGRDRRVQFWDLFNEADNPNRPAYDKFEPANKADLALALLRKTFAWAREVDPRQPLTAGIWGDGGALTHPSPLTQYLLANSDIITFHNYAGPDDVRTEVAALKKLNRPVICTEYMARPVGSTFDPILGIFKAERVGAYNWGFVSGKTQTIYPWDSWTRTYTAEPPLWFHDILRPDGTPYLPKEVEYIRAQTGKAAK